MINKTDIEQWKSQNVEALEALLQHNDNIIQDNNKKIRQIKECNTKIEEILKQKREEQAQQKIQEQTEQLNIVLSLMEHTPTCQQNKKSKSYNLSWVTPGIYENGKCFCPKCTLQYLVENPWAGFGFRITAEFDLNGDGFYE